MKIAFLGTGRLGTELAKHLISNPDVEVSVWNRTVERALPLGELGATVAATTNEAVAGADAVVSCLFNADAVRENIIDTNLIPEGVVWADATTVSPSDGEEFAAQVESYVATPVVGTLGPARNQALGVYVGSAREDFRQQAYELVKVWGAANPERVKQVDSARKAALGKLLANLALAVTAQGYREALQFGDAQGLSAAEVSELLDSTGLAFIRNMKSPFVLGERSTDPGDFTVDAIAKDAGIILEAAGHDLPAIAGALDSLTQQQAAGRGDHDFSAILVNRAVD